MAKVAEGKHVRLSLRLVRQTLTAVPKSVTQYDCKGRPLMQLATANPFPGPTPDLLKSMEEGDSAEFVLRLTPQAADYSIFTFAVIPNPVILSGGDAARSKASP